MSLLPSFASLIKQTIIQSPPTEYGIDFKTGQLTGEIVTGLEAIKVWIWLAVKTERYRYPVYSWQYGAELEQYIGQGYTKEFLDEAVASEIEDCLTINPHIQGIEDFTCKLEQDRLEISFVVKTDYGEAKISV